MVNKEGIRPKKETYTHVIAEEGDILTMHYKDGNLYFKINEEGIGKGLEEVPCPKGFSPSQPKVFIRCAA